MREIEFDFSEAGQIKEQLEMLIGRMNREVLAEMEELIQRGPDTQGSESGKQLRKFMTEETLKLKESVQLLKCAEEAMEKAIITAKQTEEKTKEIARERTY